MKKNLTFLMALSICLLFTACSKDDDEGTGGNTNTSGGSATNIVINENGKASNGSIFSAVDDKNFYLDYIKYTVEEGHLVVSGYDKTGFNGEAKIVSSITYNGNFYEVLGIGSSAFSGCTGLTSLTLPNSVTSIGGSAFLDCTSLTSLMIPANVTTIGEKAFSGCTGLTSIVVDKNNSVYDSRENCNAIIETATNTMMVDCSTTVVPESVTAIISDIKLSGEWEGYWGMYYTDAEGKQYNSYQSSVVFYPDATYDTTGQGYQIDWYRREDGSPYEKMFYSFTWYVDKKIIYLNYPGHPELNARIRNYDLNKKHFTGYFNDSSTRFDLNVIWKVYKWSDYAALNMESAGTTLCWTWTGLVIADELTSGSHYHYDLE